nr:hypothetical protein [Tanacetum cinerariifolium]
MTQSGSRVAGLSSSGTGFIQFGLMFSRLMIEELGAVLTLKLPNHVFSFYLDMNLVEEEGLDRHDTFFVFARSIDASRTSFGKLSEAISKWSLKSYVNCLFDNSSFCSSAATRAANSESNVLCYDRGGRSGRVVVVSIIVAIKIGA